MVALQYRRCTLHPSTSHATELSKSEKHESASFLLRRRPDRASFTLTSTGYGVANAIARAKASVEIALLA
jgi:hypothetical protein